MMQCIEGDITLFTLEKYLVAFPAIFTDHSITLDFSKVGQIDSSLLSYVLHIIRHAMRNGQMVYFSHLPANFSELTKLYGIDGLLQPYLHEKQ
jgi:ABC-type transporter Mla MlaB component